MQRLSRRRRPQARRPVAKLASRAHQALTTQYGLFLLFLCAVLAGNWAWGVSARACSNSFLPGQASGPRPLHNIAAVPGSIRFHGPRPDVLPAAVCCAQFAVHVGTFEFYVMGWAWPVARACAYTVRAATGLILLTVSYRMLTNLRCARRFERSVHSVAGAAARRPEAAAGGPQGGGTSWRAVAQSPSLPGPLGKPFVRRCLRGCDLVPPTSSRKDQQRGRLPHRKPRAAQQQR